MNKKTKIGLGIAIGAAGLAALVVGFCKKFVKPAMGDQEACDYEMLPTDDVDVTSDEE